ncbi:MAG: alpha/beta hydrolase [Siphonobacter aquaeclarae]|nr:alpha/beta hydrolase [Siphonobacter aquaeclarae]
MKAQNTSSRTVVFVTGAFVSHISWAEWQTYFESRGYTVYAPAWPHKDGDPAVLRSQQPHAGIASVGLDEVLDYYTDFIRQLPEKPILVGHSLGGLMVQLLLQRDIAVAGVAIHPAPPQGVLTFKWSFYKATWRPLGFFSSVNESFLMTLDEWKYAFTNGMSEEEQRSSYEKYVIPESRRASRQALTRIGRVDFTRPHVPLLITSGSEDNILPASLNYTNFKKYRTPGSVTDYKEFPGRNHYVLGQPTWKEDADYILNWLEKNKVSAASPEKRSEVL